VDKTLLDALFQPKSIAVVGASTKPGKIGYTVTDRLIKDGYPGPIYPINPGASELLGLKVYPSVSACPGPVDAAVVVVPAEAVKDALLDCAQKGVKGIILITSGFAEIGEKELEQEIVRIAHENNMRILGPNIVGILSNTDKMNASFCPFLPFPGRAALLSQSGALVIAIDAATYSRRVGFDKLVSLGNMADVDFTDCVEWLAQDENTSCISLYIEGFRDGRRFMDIARKTGKPIIALKAGVSAHGAAAAASHTGSLAGAVKVYGAAFTQCGVVQASDLDNLFDRVLALSLQPPMRGDNLLIITNGGGIGVLATDAAERCGIPLKFAPPDVQAELKKHMPVFGSAKNPVDITGMAGPDWYLDAVRYALTHPWLDGLAVLYCETAQTEPLEIAKTIRQAVTESGVTDKPVCACFVGGERSLKAMQWLVESGIPAYAAPDTAVNAMAALYEYGQMRAAVAANDIPSADPAARGAALKIIQQARSDGRTALTEIEAKQVFAAYGMPVTATRLAKSEDEAAALAKQTGFPLVLKIVSPDIIHKSDAGGVKVNLKDEAAVRQAYRDILQNAKAYKADADIHGVAVQEMAEWGAEVILGSVNDPSFGPTVMFGLGGIFVEALKDVTFRVAPIGVSQAAGMMSEIRGAPILAGVRGEKPRDRQAMAAVISRYSQMVTDLMDEIAETDANPVLLYEEGKGLKVVDARIILKKK